MAYYLILEDNLLKLFYDFQSGQCQTNPNRLFKLLNFYKRHLTNVEQLRRIGNQDTALERQLAQMGYINQTLEELAQKTLLKIILSETRTDYPYVNVNGDVFESNFTATYSQTVDRNKALNHITDLIKEGDNIEIYDKYLLRNQGNNNIQNHPSVEVIEKFLSENPNAHFKLICLNYSGHNQQEKQPDRINYLQNRFTNRISFNLLNRNSNNLHDRYIKVCKSGNQIYEIILSSGIFYLKNTNNDLTYIVRVL